MCGIVGICRLQAQSSIDEGILRQMLAMLRHRGPDQFGIYRDSHLGFANARLSIIDLHTGQQPLCNEDASLWIVFNGEIFNYLELRAELEIAGHQFSTNSDTEVILHLYEEYGVNALSRLNGQFALAIWDTNHQELFMARDRSGICPLFYTIADGMLIFGSEIKALLAHPSVHAELDPLALDQIFSYWSTISPRTIFLDILEVPPAHYLLLRDNTISIKAWWQHEFPTEQPKRQLEDYLAEFRELLINASQIRLRADVPVGAYLSGGLDSSTIAAIIRNYGSSQLTSFSIRFSDSEFDESPYQAQMRERLGTEHHEIVVDGSELANTFPEIIWHTETPILRTAPAPMYLLSRLVRSTGFKVVLTGEGADESLAGYDIFREAKIRRFWAKQPESVIRPALLQRLYPYIPMLNNSSSAYLAAFFGQGLNELDSWDYSHSLRWNSTARTKRFFSAALQDEIKMARNSTMPDIELPANFSNWHPLARAQYLESKIFMSQYLLSSQGDRMTMANSVEGRYPFLDHRLIEFCNQLPPNLKLHGMTEKYLLKILAKEWLPESILKRSKQAYRAPIHRSFFSSNPPEYLREQFSFEHVQSLGIFDAAMVQKLVHKVQRGLPIGEIDDMALAGILSTQILIREFIENFRTPQPLADADVKVCIGAELI